MLDSSKAPKRKKNISKKQLKENFIESKINSNILSNLYFIAKYGKNLFITTIIGMLFIVSTIYIGSFLIEDDYREQSSIQHLQDMSSKLLAHALFLRRYEKDFTISKKLSLIDLFHEHGQSSLRIIDEMKMTMASDSIRSSLDRMTSKIQEHMQNFDLLVNDFKLVGLNEKEGFKGQMRKSAHIVEGYLNEDGLSQFMQVFLMIRRYEKDFLLRKSEKYLVEVARGIDEFERLVKEAPFKSNTKDTIYRISEQYREKFNLLASKLIVIKEKEENMERIYEDFSIVLGQVNDYINGLIEETRTKSTYSLFKFKSFLSIISLIFLIISGFYGIMLMRRVSKLTDQS